MIFNTTELSTGQKIKENGFHATRALTLKVNPRTRGRHIVFCPVLKLSSYNYFFFA